MSTKTLMTQLGEFLADKFQSAASAANTYADNAVQNAAQTTIQAAKTQAVAQVADDLRNYIQMRDGDVGGAFLSALGDEIAYAVTSALADYTAHDLNDKGQKDLVDAIAAIAQSAGLTSEQVSAIAQNIADTAIADLVNSAPDTLDTLGEIAEMLQTHDDALSAINAAVAAHDHDDATQSTHGFMSTTDKTKLDNLGDYDDFKDAYNAALSSDYSYLQIG